MKTKKSKSSKHGHAKEGRKVNKFSRVNKLAAIFVIAFAAIGSYLLIQSRAATGNDLIVTDVSMNPVNPSVGQEVTFSATIENQGTTAVPSGVTIGVGFEVDGSTVTWNRSKTDGLAAGASVTLTANAGVSGATWTATTGPHTVTAIADDQNNIPDENNEANNIRTLSFTVGSTGELYIDPPTTDVLVDEGFTVEIRLDPGTTVDGVEATLTYDPSKMQFVSLNSDSSPFDTELISNTSSGTIEIARGNLEGGVSSDALVTQVTFTALAGSGSDSLQIDGNATTGGAYTNPVTTDASVTFDTPDTASPSVSITSPSNGTTVLLDQTVSVNASDNVGVTRVELYVDGQLKGTDNSAPYSFNLDTTTIANGSRTLQARAYDEAGNVGQSAGVNITVKNWAEDINQDGQVNLLDFSLLASKFGDSGGNLGRADINGDGTVNLLDFSLLAGRFGQ